MKKQLLQTFNRVAESAVGGEKCANTPPVWAKGASYRVIAVIFMFCMLGIGSMWADVSWTEDYHGVDHTAPSVSIRTAFNGNYANWHYYYARSRYTEDDKDVISGTTRAFWITNNGTDKEGYLECDLAEGGIKSISFDWRQATPIDESDAMYLSIQADDTEVAQIETIATNPAISVTPFSSNLNIKTNVKLTLKNLSTSTQDLSSHPNRGRFIVGPITITPYLRYMQKEVTIGLPNKGYINRNLLDQIEGGHTITYSIHDKDAETQDVATIDPATGAITPKAAGTAVVTATWTGEGAYTTYELTVSATTYLEAFSKATVATALDKNSEQSWDNCGDVIPSWKVWEARRKVGVDTILGTYVQGTQIRALANANCPNGYIKTAAGVEGGIKAATMKWKQYGQAANTSLQLQAYFDGEAAGDASVSHSGNNTDPRTNIWTYNPNFSEITTPTNPVFEIRNISTRSSGDKKANVVIGSITITPWLLYYDKSVEWDRTVDDNASITNTALIDNTEGTITYSISENTIGAAVDGDGVVTATGGGTVTVTASWEQVTTSYNLHIKANTTASFTNPVVNKNITEIAFTIAVNKTPNMAVANYTSSNENVAIVDENGTVTVRGVGQTTITATIAEDENYGGSSASYNLYVTDNSANVLVETFENVSQETETNDTIPWHGKLFDWRVFQVRRNSTSDTIRISEQGTWIRIHNAKRGFMQSKDAVEGGIKHISFYWRQWATESGQTLRLAVLAGEKPAEATRIEKMERSCESGGTGALHEKYLFGASNVMRSNQKLVIRNESFTGEAYAESSTPAGTSVSRLIIDDIHITPWLLYTRKSVSIAVDGGTFTNTALINTTAGETGTLSYRSLNETVATVNGSGVVTPHAIGVTTIEAKFDWGGGNYVTTTYQLNVVSALTWTEDYSKFPSRGMQEEKITDPGVYLDWYYRFARSRNEADKHDYITGTTRGVWTSHYNRNTEDNKATYLGCETEGGIKHVYFQWRQYTKDDNGDQLYLTVNAGNVEKYSIKPEKKNDDTYYANLQTVDEEFEVKTNADFRIFNISTTDRVLTDDKNIGRIIIGPITITPYLFYLEREVTITKNKSYVHPLLDNTENEGTITYTLVDPSPSDMATINARTGEVIATKNGTVTVKATWSEGAYTTYTLHVQQALTINDNVDNRLILTAYNGETADVNTNRTLVANAWNTLCMPFEISVSDLGENAEVQDLFGVEQDGDDLIFGFKPLVGEVLEAGHPYLVKPAGDDNVTLTGFEGKTIVAEPMTLTRGEYALVGVFSPLTLTNDGKTLFVGPDNGGNNLYYPNSTNGNLMNGFRAYFKKVSGPAQAPKRVRYVVNYHNTATDVEEVSGERPAVSEKVIRDGHLYVIRSGRMYNAQGARVQ